MKTLFTRTLSTLLLVGLPTIAGAQLAYTVNNGAITITGYSGPVGAVTIPSTMVVGSSTLPVTSIASLSPVSSFPSSTVTSITIPGSVTNIGYYAFAQCTSLTNVILGSGLTSIAPYAFQLCDALPSLSLPDSVTSIGIGAFYDCQSLASLTLSKGLTGLATNMCINCLALRRLAIPNGVTNIPQNAFQFCVSLASVTIPTSVTNIQPWAFRHCYGLTNITIPQTVTSLSAGAFDDCTALSGVFFKGKAPSAAPGVFSGDTTTAYYLPGTTGWGTNLGGATTVLWNPQVPANDGAFGVRASQFGFTIAGAADIPVVVEACATLGQGYWIPLQSCTLTNGSIHFTDPLWTNYPSRLYRLRSP